MTRDLRKKIASSNLALSYKDKTVKDGYYLGLALTIEQINQFIKESKTRSTGYWRDPETRTEPYPLEERFSYKNFDLSEVFQTLDLKDYNKIEAEEYYSLDSWENYCSFLSNNKDLSRSKLLNSAEWNELGFDEEG